MASVLDIQDLRCDLGPERVEVLRGLCLTVEVGELVCVAGRSGAGKSTLARCAAGLIPRVFPGRVSGRIRIAGAPLRDLSPWEVAQRVGIVSQDPGSQIFTDTVEDEVAFGPENLGLAPSEIGDRLDRALAATALTALRHARSRSLSLGQQQRVAVASVLALRPRLLILDEPTSMLDEAAAVALFEHLAAVAAGAQVAFLVLEHRTRFIERYASRLVVIEGGTVAYDGPPGAVRSDGFCTSFGLRTPRAPAGAPQLVAAEKASGERIASLENLGFAYRNGREVLSEIDLDLHSGSAVVVEGPNGAGKTTLLRLLAGLLRPSCGQVRRRNHRRGSTPKRGQVSFLRLMRGGSPYPPRYGGRKRGGYGDPPRKTYVSPPRRDGGIAFIGQEPLYLFRHDDVESEYRSWQRTRHGDPPDNGLLERLDLAHLCRRHPFALSEGEKRRLAVAAMLSTDPELALLDEPSIGCDGQHLEQMLEVLAEQVTRGGALVVASNDPDVLERGWPQRLELPPPVHPPSGSGG